MAIDTQMKVIIKTQIHSCFASVSSEDIYVYKVFDLPFAPFAGLVIGHKTKKGETDDITIEEVIWEDDRQCFLCYQKSDKEIYDAQLHKETHRHISKIVEEYEDADWLICDKD